MRKTTPNPSLRASYMSASGVHGVGQSARHMSKFSGSQSRKNILDQGSSNGKSDGPGKDRGHHTTGRLVRVLDEDGTDVTPQPLCPVESGDTQTNQGRLFLDEIFSSSGSEHSQSSSSIRSSRKSSFCDRLPPTSTEDGVLKLDIPTPYVLPKKSDSVKKQITEEEVVDIYLTESDTISLLDIPPTCISEDDDDAEAVKERNIQYTELCQNRMDNDRYVARSTQTFNGDPKDKQIQCQHVVMVEKGTIATMWDIYDSLSKPSETTELETDPNTTLSTGNIPETSQEHSSSSSSSSVYTSSSISSVFETDGYWKSLSVEPNPQEIMGSESFQNLSLVMFRNVVANVFQPKLAAYKQLPVLDDPYSAVKPRTVEQTKEPPALECLWAFSCELTSGWSINSISLNKMDPNLLAVGYGELKWNKPGLICCWSLKNLMWPEHVFHCHSSATCLAFSANHPSHLAVGMFDGTVALYNIQFPDDMACFTSSKDCPNKHLQPVWQVRWSWQDEIRVEALVSVSEDGRVKKWHLCSSGLECIDLMELKRPDDKKKKQSRVVASLMPAFCVDFHSVESSIYLIGTQGGLIHKCSLTDPQRFLETYQKHFVQVNHIEWSPFSPDVFLSCSSDWTIQLWRRSHPTPVISFTCSQRAVTCVSWSPNHPSVFAAINGRQVEVWDLNTSILEPTIVHQATPGVRMTALLMPTGSDCVLVGDSDGRVSVYKPQNFTVGSGKQVHSLDDIVHFAVSRGQMAQSQSSNHSAPL